MLDDRGSIAGRGYEFFLRHTASFPIGTGDPFLGGEAAEAWV